MISSKLIQQMQSNLHYPHASQPGSSWCKSEAYLYYLYIYTYIYIYISLHLFHRILCYKISEYVVNTLKEKEDGTRGLKMMSWTGILKCESWKSKGQHKNSLACSYLGEGFVSICLGSMLAAAFKLKEYVVHWFWNGAISRRKIRF